MNRFFGLMPVSEIEILKYYKDEFDLKIEINAGKNGYTIIFSDHSSIYEDIVDTAENNFNKALSKLKQNKNIIEYQPQIIGCK